MKFFAKSFMSFFLAAWILFGSLGISWTEATCIYTGAKKTTITKAESCCKKTTEAHISRAKCCLLGKYQVKFNFDLTKGNTAMIFAFTPISVSSFYQNLDLNHQDPGYFSYHSNAPPLAQQIRLAQLQTYLI
ncbi:HYC_CC_PP family protein [Aquirufa antheringensis]